jgi:uncharacterized protein YidB (DUF937 family)
MSMLDGLLGALGGSLGGQGTQGTDPLLKLAMSLLAGSGQQGGEGGGLGALLAALERGGLGQEAQSWVGTGSNLPVSGDQLQQALGGDLLGGLAGQLGMSQGDASSGLAALLPQLIDRLTPQGQVPAAGGLGDVASIMEALGARRG